MYYNQQCSTVELTKCNMTHYSRIQGFVVKYEMVQNYDSRTGRY